MQKLPQKIKAIIGSTSKLTTTPIESSMEINNWVSTPSLNSTLSSIKIVIEGSIQWTRLSRWSAKEKFWLLPRKTGYSKMLQRNSTRPGAVLNKTGRTSSKTRISSRLPVFVKTLKLPSKCSQRSSRQFHRSKVQGSTKTKDLSSFGLEIANLKTISIPFSKN